MSDQTIQECDTLLMAIVQAQDADLIDNILQEMNISITRLPSTGGL